MNLERVTGPSVLPLSLAEVKDHIRIDVDTDDAYLAGLVNAVTDHLDGWSGTLGRCLVNQTWKLSLPKFTDVIELPLPPLQSVSSVKYYDTDDTLQTVATSVYEVVTRGTYGGYVRRLTSQSWPGAVSTEKGNPIEITFVAGYGDSWNDVPMPIRQAMLMMCEHFHENRGQVSSETLMEIPYASDALLTPYRMVG